MIRLINKIITAKGVKKATRLWAIPYLDKQINRDLSYIENSPHAKRTSGNELLYVRSDFWLKGRGANGAVAHTEGVVNALYDKGLLIDIFSTYPLDFINNYRSCYCCTPNGLFTGISEIEEMEYNSQLYSTLLVHNGSPSFVYQRYSRNNYAGLLYAKKHGIPFVLEYNGSEIWMSKNWGKPLRYDGISTRIESTVLTNADIVVGNAEAFREELINKGVDSNRIAIIPNGVDPDRFNPNISGSEIRNLLMIDDDTVLVSFVGSYGPWHGTEVLANSIRYVVRHNKNIKFLFIGEGKGLEQVKGIVQNDNVGDYVLYPGLIERDKIPQYLAASDILVSPQVPNPDGSPFFGSPTKLFEYMAMGKAIVASSLDQIGEILSSGEDALLFHPGDYKELADMILLLAQDLSLRYSIGKNARKKVVERYTWDQHVQVILDKLDSI